MSVSHFVKYLSVLSTHKATEGSCAASFKGKYAHRIIPFILTGIRSPQRVRIQVGAGETVLIIGNSGLESFASEYIAEPEYIGKNSPIPTVFLT